MSHWNAPGRRGKRWHVTRAPIAISLGLLVRAHAAYAEPDSFGLGSGIDGALSVTTSEILNDYAPITADTGGAGTTVSIGPLAVTGGPGFSAGNLVLVWQTVGLPSSAAPSGAATPVSLNGAVGAYELARIDHIAGATLTLTHPLVNEYAAAGAQVVRVPEYTTADVQSGVIEPYAWDGRMGGVVALFANNGVGNGDHISASGAGLRGGIDEPNATAVTGCRALDGPAGAGGASGGGAHKGEGLVTTAFSAQLDAGAAAYGYGNVATGGGGGDCLEASGGGGGNGGAGGLGGASLDDGGAVGGLGGVALSFDPTHYLALGGGGGAGNDVAGGVTSASGAAGGGVIFIRAASLSSDAPRGIQALGGTPPGPDPSVSQAVASGGGGAGGTILLQIAGPASCGGSDGVDASGGQGGAVTPWMPASAGGGGGGGLIFASAEVDDNGCGFHAYAGFGQIHGTGQPGIVETSAAFAATTCSFLAGGCGGCTTSASPSLCPPDHPACDEPTHTCVECVTDADCADSVYGGVCGAGNRCGVCSASANVCSGSNPVCDATGSRTTCVACNGDLGTIATHPCPGIMSPYCKGDGSCGTCGTEGASIGCELSGGGVIHTGPVCGTGGACTTMCTADSDCGAGYCDPMDVCHPLLPSGSTCGRAAECAGNACIGNACADQAVDGGMLPGDAGAIRDAAADAERGDGGGGARTDASGATGSNGADSGADQGPPSNSGGCSCRSSRSDDAPVFAMVAMLTGLTACTRRRKRA